MVDDIIKQSKHSYGNDQDILVGIMTASKQIRMTEWEKANAKSVKRWSRHVVEWYRLTMMTMKVSSCYTSMGLQVSISVNFQATVDIVGEEQNIGAPRVIYILL